MNESLIVEMWDLLREYCDKKQIALVAERYVDLLGDHGASDQNLEDVLGHDDYLDDAIRTMLDIDEDESDEYDYDDE